MNRDFVALSRDSHRELRRKLNESRRAVLRPPPLLSVPDWADRFRRLSASVGAFGGKWKTSRVEVARGPMLAVTEPGVETITAMTCTQVLKTELILNTLGYYSHLDPAPILLLQPKDEMASSFSKERIMPMVNSSPELKKLIGDSRTRNSEDTITYKTFPGGFMAISSAGSPSNLAMRAIRVTLLDEIDKYETTKEGDPVLLAEERSSTFEDQALHIRTCSPTTEETSRIYKSYLEGDQRMAYCHCPHCQEWISLDFFRNVEWEKDPDGNHLASSAHIYCDRCGTQWTEAQRKRIMTTRGAVRHYQTRKFRCCDEDQDPKIERLWDWVETDRMAVGMAKCKHCGGHPVSNAHASFQVSKLYSPFTTTVKLVRKWLDSMSDPESKQTFINTQLGLPFKMEVSKAIEGNSLAKRAEVYEHEVPKGVITLTAGCDVQQGALGVGGRIEVEVVGWGLGEESWSIATHVIEGDPALPQTWAELDRYLMKPWIDERGLKRFISAACIDSGGSNTQDVYKYARDRLGRNIWAIKGASDMGGSWSPLWPVPSQNQKHRKTRTGYKPIILGVNAGKESIRQRLLIKEPGPGYCHFPAGRPMGWFDQLTSEELRIEKRAGHVTRQWKKKSKDAANEALDCRVYAYAALHGLYVVRQHNLALQAKALAAYHIHDPEFPERTPKPPQRTMRRSNFTGG